MAVSGVWFSLISLFVLKMCYVSASDCSDLENIVNCNDCSSCGGYWCQKTEEWQTHCSRKRHETCMDSFVEKDFMLNVTKNSKSPRNIQRSLTAGIPHRIPIYSSSDQINIKLDTARKISVVKSKLCEDTNSCVSVIEAVIGAESCGNSETAESIEVVISENGVDEEFRIKYQPTCTCECSKNVVQKSGFCNGHGSLSCGACSCDSVSITERWAGEYCDYRCDTSDRGDLDSQGQCISQAKPDVKCAGNGYCGPCGPCECLRDPKVEGSQYYQEETQCIDICTHINYFCYQCLHNFTVGNCEEQCDVELTRYAYNQSLLEEKFDEHRHVWVNCKITENNCDVEYAARGGGNEFGVMLVKGCSGNAATIVSSTDVKVPVILGCILVAAGLAAAAGYLVWKNRTPPMSESTGQVQNLDAEGAVGRNPLYKPPTSYFRNPTYGRL